MSNLQTENAITLVKPKHTLLPVLVVLFMVSYGLMTMLIVEQARTIDTQRFLIKQLFSDSAQLTAMRSSAVEKQNQAKARAHGQNSPAQANPAEKPKTGKSAASKSANRLQSAPIKPPKQASDTADERRSMVTI